MKFFKKTNIYRCKILDRYKIDIEKTNQLYLEKYGGKGNPIDREWCELVAENEDYNFYGYRTHSDRSGGFILRQDKSKPKNIVYFGKSKTFNIVFRGYLFQVKHIDTSGFGDSDNLAITARNTKSGQQICFRWLSGKYLWRGSNYGHVNSQDSVNDVRVEGDKLIFEVTRRKSGEVTNDEYDRDTDYILEVEYDGERFKAAAIFPPVE